MKSRFYLPPSTKPKDVEATLAYHHQSNDAEHQQYSYEWTRTHWFLQGVRRLRVAGAGQQRPSPHYVDSSTQRRVRVERVLQLLQTEMGRILSIDIGPAVERTPGVGLDRVRSDAITQVALDNYWDRFNNRNFHLGLAYALAAYGTVGIGAFDAGETSGGIHGVDMSLVPAWELRPLPGCVTGVDQVAGVEWFRWVPLDVLKKSFGDILTIPKGDDDRMGVMEVPAGSHIQVDWSPNQSVVAGLGGHGRAYNIPGGHGPTSGDTTVDTVPLMKHVQLREFWTYGDDYSCLRWCVMLGDHLALDVDYTSEKDRNRIGLLGSDLPIAPLHVARYLSVGSFWGRGLADRHIGLNRELELLLGDMIQDMRDLGRLRALTVPTTSGINKRNLKAYLKEKILPFQPDYAAPTLRPDILNPPTAGDIPGKTLGVINTLMDQTASQGPLFGGEVPGRTDTIGGLDRIIAQNKVPMFPIADSIESAMSGVWKSVEGIISRHLKEDDTLTLTRLDESVIGVTFDRETGTISLRDNPLPPPQETRLTIRNKFPTSKELIKSQLDEMLQAGLISTIQYKIASIREGLNLPWTSRAEYENYVTAWSENIALYGDGKTPGEVTVSKEAHNHPIHLAVLMDFMGSPLLQLATPIVRLRFQEHKALHLTEMGAFPEGLESPDQFGNVSQPPDQVAGVMGAGVPPSPGQSPLPDMLPGGLP